jgi:hypothetical protein
MVTRLWWPVTHVHGIRPIQAYMDSADLRPQRYIHVLLRVATLSIDKITQFDSFGACLVLLVACVVAS